VSANQADDKSGPKPKIVAAIPCFNEDRAIGSMVIKTKKYVDRVIIIDDGSTDTTAEVACEAGAAVCQHAHNKGYGAAIRSALQQGIQLGADILVIIDGDGQHDPAEIPKRIKPLLDGEADVVIGSRFLGSTTRPPFYRRLGQHTLTAATNLGSGQKLSDSQSGFRAYSAKALKELNLAESGMSVSSEIQFAISKSGLKVAEVPIEVSYLGESKRSPLGHGLGVLSRIFVLASLKNPLLLFGIPGLALMISGLILGVGVLTSYNDTRELAVGNALITILLCLAGLLSLFVALMLSAMKELMRGEVAQLAREVIGSTSYKESGKEESG